MATTRKPAETRSVEELLTALTEPVQYDVARGLERHQRLVAAATSLPAWARPDADPQLVPSTQARRFRKRGWWVVWSLSLASTVWLAATSGSELESAQPRQSAPHGRSAPRAVEELGSAPASAPEVVELATTRKLTTADVAAENALRQGEPTIVQLPERAEAEPPILVEPLAARVGTREVGGAGPSSTGSAVPASAPALTSHARPERALEDAPSTRASKQTRARAMPTSASSRGASGRGQPKADSPLDAEEMRQLHQAEQLLAPAPLETLKLVRAGEVTFRGGYFAQERRYLEVMALFALGRRDEAEARAAWFLRDYPEGPYRHKVELAVLRHAAR